MRKSKIFVVTSCKGGVGKSTVAVNTAYCLAELGKKTLLIDCDFEVPCLDIMTGHENDALFDCSDIMNGIVDTATAAIRDGNDGNLMLIAAPRCTTHYTNEQFSEFVGKAADELGAEYVIIDTPGDRGYSYKLALASAGGAIIVTTQSPTALRAAEGTAGELFEHGISCRLVVNSFDLTDIRSVRSGERPGIIEMIDRTHVRLLGVIPYSYALTRAVEDGAFCDKAGNDEYAAFMNIARRLTGEDVNLFYGFYKTGKIKRALFR